MIIALDWVKGTFDWIDGPTLLTSLGISADHFMDACILAGTSVNAAFPVIGAGERHTAFERSLRYVQQHGGARGGLLHDTEAALAGSGMRSEVRAAARGNRVF